MKCHLIRKKCENTNLDLKEAKIWRRCSLGHQISAQRACFEARWNDQPVKVRRGALSRAGQTSGHCAMWFHRANHYASSGGGDLGPTCRTMSAAAASSDHRPETNDSRIATHAETPNWNSITNLCKRGSTICRLLVYKLRVTKQLFRNESEVSN